MLDHWSTNFQRIDDKARARKQSRSAGQWSRIPINPNGIRKSAANGGKERALREKREREKKYILANNGILPAADGTGAERILRSSTRWVNVLCRGASLSFPDVFCPRRVCFHRGKVFFIDETEREREKEKGNPIEFEVPAFSIDFSPSWWNFKKEKTR